MEVIALIQARMGSTRLPGKVLMDLAGEPMLARVVNRVQRANLVNRVVVTTSTNPADDTLEQLCVDRDWAYFRGSENDVLDRYYHAAQNYEANTIVRITADCPLIEPSIIDHVIHSFFQQAELDYASNTLPPRTFPRGLDTEVISFSALERAWLRDTNTSWREHVSPYIYRNPELFKIRKVGHVKDLSTMRWTVDTDADITFVRKIYNHFGDDRFSWLNILTLLDKNPDWLAINLDIKQKSI